MTSAALIGCGRWGRNILRDLNALGCEVTVADPDPEARRIAMANGAHDVVSDFDDLPDSDGIVIATPTSMHASLIDRSLTREVPVFVEKPMTNDAQTARRLADRGEGRLFVMDKWRYHPGIEKLREIRVTCELGRPLGMRLLHAGWGMLHHDVDIVWILLPHCLSIVLEVFGVLPAAKQAFPERLDGELVTLAGALGNEPWVRFEVSSRSPVKRREIRLHCESGVAWLEDSCANHIRISRGKNGNGCDAPDVESRPVSDELPLLRELRAFVLHLNGGPPPRSNAADGALTVERIAELRELASLF